MANGSRTFYGVISFFTKDFEYLGISHTFRLHDKGNFVEASVIETDFHRGLIANLVARIRLSEKPESEKIYEREIHVSSMDQKSIDLKEGPRFLHMDYRAYLGTGIAILIGLPEI